jgi:hypothetical protein
MLVIREKLYAHPVDKFYCTSKFKQIVLMLFDAVSVFIVLNANVCTETENNRLKFIYALIQMWILASFRE